MDCQHVKDINSLAGQWAICVCSPVDLAKRDREHGPRQCQGNDFICLLSLDSLILLEEPSVEKSGSTSLYVSEPRPLRGSTQSHPPSCDRVSRLQRKPKTRASRQAALPITREKPVTTSFIKLSGFVALDMTCFLLLFPLHASSLAHCSEAAVCSSSSTTELLSEKELLSENSMNTYLALLPPNAKQRIASKSA